MKTELEKGELGSAIRAARLEKHLSQEELAELVGITPTHVKHIESEHRKPSIELLYRLVRTLNLSLDTLFFPERADGLETYRKTERLMRQCNEKQLQILYATIEAMLREDS
jgi:transcriptional regulator with XRE-family HTH domain